MQDGHRAVLVLVLRALVLAGHDEPARLVRDPDSGIGPVDMLAAGAGRPVGVDFKVVRIDVDFDVVSFRQDGDGDRRGVDPAAGFGDRDTLDAVDAAFKFESAESTAAFDHEDDFLEAAHFGLVQVDQFGTASPAASA